MNARNEVLHSLKPALELMNDAVIVTTADLEPPGPRVVFVNRALRKLVNLGSREVLGAPLGLLCDRQTGDAILRKLFEDLEELVRRAGASDADGEDGSKTIEAWQVVPVADESGKVLYWLSIHRDMQPFCDAEYHRTLAEQLHWQLTEYQQQPVCRLLPNTTLAYVNVAYADLFHCKPKDLIGKRAIEVVSAEHVPAILAHLASFTPDNPSGQFEYKHVLKDGGFRWHLWNTFVQFDDDGEVSSFQSIGTDITRRREAEEELRRSHLLMDSVSRAQSRFIAEGSEKEVFDSLLEDLLVVTESEFGFIAEVFRTTEDQPYIRTHAITNIAWDDETREFVEKYDPSGIEFFNMRTLFGEVINSRKPVIANSPSTDPRRGGLPKGHSPLKSFLGVPFLVGDEILGMAGIANRPGGYDEAVVAFLELFLTTCGNLIYALRSDRERRKAEAATHFEKERMENYLAIAGNMFVSLDREGTITLANNKTCEVLDRPKEQLIGKNWFEIAIPEAEAKQVFADFVRIMRGEIDSFEIYENDVQTKNGDRRAIAWHNSILKDAEGNVTGTLSSGEDITERKQAEGTLRKLSSAVEHSPSSILITDAEGIIEYVNPAFVEISGYAPSEVIGQNSRILKSGLMPDHFFDELWRTICAGMTWRGELTNKKKNGEIYWDLVAIAPVKTASGAITHFVGVQNDITEQKLLEAQLAHDATHDALTNLVNRREFETRLENAVAAAKEHGLHHVLCYLDLDQFKLVNDTAGHAAGDELLREIRRMLSGRFRGRDTVARLGGDEFGLLLENCMLDRAFKIGEMVIASMRDFRFTWHGQTFRIGVSIGLAAISEDTESAAQVMARADVALYDAKERGRNCIRVYHKGGIEHHNEILRAVTLRDAVDEDRFCLHGQPISPLSAGGDGAVWYEILVRMIDRNGELVMPNSFIPAAERYGLMSAIDRWVIKNAFRNCAEMFAGPSPVKIAINLSGNTLNDETFLGFLQKQFSDSRLSEDRVCFEITETAAIQNIENLTQLIAEIRNWGSRFSLDDFGSGLSSFHYLKTLPVDYLKIDGRFVQDMVESTVDGAMVSAINDVGHIMGIKTIAEYAHSKEIVQRLTELGVDYAQGYALGAPIPLDEVVGRATVN